MKGPLLTIEAAAQRLSVSKSLIKKWVVAGEIEVIRLGTGKRRLIRIRPETLEEFVARREVAPVETEIRRILGS